MNKEEKDLLIAKFGTWAGLGIVAWLIVVILAIATVYIGRWLF